MEQTVFEYIEKNHMIEEKSLVVAGVSGGADSMCLLRILMAYRRKKPFELLVVHVNHGIRGAEAQRDETYVRDYCAQNGLDLKCVHADVPEAAVKNHQSLEEAGRIIRYEAFERAAAEYIGVCSGYRIAVAHHANDLAETVLFNLLRGSGIRGGRGILPINGSIIRPLLCVTRKQIEDYLNSEKITYVTDSTNQDCDYTRNKLRNIVIPYLEENINAGAVENLCSFAEILADTQQHLQKEAQLAAKDCREQYGNVIWLKEDVRKLDRAVRGELLRETLAILTSSLKDIANTHVCTVEKMFQLTAGSAADLPYGIKCLRGYQGVYLYPSGTDIYQMPEIAQLELGSIPLECEERIRFLKEPVNENQKIPLNGYTKYFDYDKIKGNLCIRRRMSGDYLILSPDGGRKLLKDYLIERKVPVALRNRIVLVADGSHILWVVGLRDSAGCRIDGNTRWVLKVWLDDGMQDGGNEHE